jgi:hypothetical protein
LPFRHAKNSRGHFPGSFNSTSDRLQTLSDLCDDLEHEARPEGVSGESRRREYALYLNSRPLTATRCGDAQFVEFAGDLPQRGCAVLAYLFKDG